MTQDRKKLVLTFVDQGNRKRKISIPRFLEGLDPESFAAHMNQLPALVYVINPEQAKRKLIFCQHAHKVEVTKQQLYTD